jgi:hypothetical protein
MRGGAQAHMMRADDGHFYVVKFQNNPQHLRVLANEFLATRLAERVGLPVPKAEIVEVGEWLIANTSDLRLELAGSSQPCAPGLQFGSRFAVNPFEGQLFDYLPESHLGRVRNLGAFAGMLAFDKWSCNANGRQAAYWRLPRQKRYTVSFIDQGYCFNAGEWSFPDASLRGVYAYNAVYSEVRGWQSFVPWIERIESLGAEDIGEIASAIPPEWYGHAAADLERLIEELVARRGKVRDLISDFRRSSRNPFPNWS